MTTQSEIANIAQKVIRAAECASVAGLRRELEAATLFARRNTNEERSELLGAIACDIRVALDSASETPLNSLGPHLRLLYHLSNQGLPLTSTLGYVN